MIGTDEQTGGPQGARRRYEPPAIEETSEFETLALACGFTEGGSGECDPNFGAGGLNS